MEFKDYYAVLGIDKSASAADVKRVYRKLARQFHPDVNPGDKAAEARFKEINEANEVLGDVEKRAKYDELGANWRAYEQGGARGSAGAPEGWSSAFGGAGGGSYRTMTPEEMQEMFGNDDPFSDFFHTFFGGAAAGGRAAGTPRASRGRNLEQTVDLTLEEALAGTTRRIAISGGGATRTVEVRIPAGIKDGARVRAAGEGPAGTHEGARGDLLLTVRLLPHPRFERRGQDLHVALPLPVTTAVLGGEVNVPTLAGTTLRLKVPTATPAGRVFRLRGHGMPTVGRPDERGDLFATVDLKIPTTLTAEERAHYQALKQLEEQRP